MNTLWKRAAAVLTIPLLAGLLAGCRPADGNAAEPPAAASAGTAAPSGSAAATPPHQPPQTPAAGEAPPGAAASAPPGEPIRSLTALRMISPAAAWIGGEGFIARTDNGGADWRVQYDGPGTVNSLFALDGNQAWAMVSERELPKDILRTMDGGKTWLRVGQAPNGGFLHFISGSTGFSAGAMTTDGGATWRELPVPDHLVGDAYFHDPANGWAVTQPSATSFSFMRTKDGGKSWTAVKKFSNTSIISAVTRSAGKDDAWIECIGDSGMSQTAYSLFHTRDGGSSWQAVIEHSTAGAGTAPGFARGVESGAAVNNGAGPGSLYAVNGQTAYMGGYCSPCEVPNTIGWTKDGGKSWNNGEQALPGYAPSQLAMADEENGWFISGSGGDPYILYATSDGGKHWARKFTFLTVQPDKGILNGVSAAGKASKAAGLVPLIWKRVESVPTVKPGRGVPAGAGIVDEKKLEYFGGIKITLYTRTGDESNVYALLDTPVGQSDLGAVGSYDFRKPENFTIAGTRLFDQPVLKITSAAGAGYAVSHYYAMNDKVKPQGLLTVDTGNSTEQDLDGDGCAEAVVSHGLPMYTYLYRWNKDHVEMTDLNGALQASSAVVTDEQIIEAQPSLNEPAIRYWYIPEGLIPAFPPLP